ncbi:autotransporter family protein [Bartonella gliris]|uniref:autotransporter family protein n=1 Tax=Bartonella gliris TaxID=3004109 RepID=UPI00295EEAD1|nr:autotransporter outer membrane beta-barrel domain-containing protein [Bartonella gliris]
MIKVLKHHVCLCALTTSVFFFVNCVGAKAQDVPSCNSLLKLYPCDAVGKLDGNKESYTNPVNTGSVDTVVIQRADNIVFEKAKKPNLSLGGTLQFKKSKSITSEVIALEKVQTILDKVSVTKNGQKAGHGRDSISHAVFGVKQGGSLLVKEGKVNVADIYGLVMESAPGVYTPSTQPLSGSRDWRSSNVFVEDSNIMIRGHGARGLYFRGSSSEGEYEEGEIHSLLGEVRFKNTKFQVPYGTAIYINDARRFPYITVSEGSRVFADLLLDVKNHSWVGIEANASFLSGGARIDKGSYAELELSNKSRWTVAPGKKNNRRDLYSTDSSLSFMRIMDSSIFFKKPEDGRYQTLRIGRLDDDNGLDYTYVAGNAQLFVNASLVTNGQEKGIKADQLLIYGNVYGKTKVYVMEASAGSGKRESHSEDGKKGSYSVSIIQVYGRAAEDSFKLATDYVALRGAPYRYSLRAYGPNSSLGKAKDKNKLIKKNLVKNNGDFWDFRLEAEYIQRSSRRSQLKMSRLKKIVSSRRKSRSVESVVDHDSSIFDPEVMVSAVVPQVPTYLLMPNALFHAGLMDVNNQNKRLESMRTTSSGMVEVHENPAFFVRSYGGSHHYASDLSVLEYGYGGDFYYNAVEAGLLLKTIEGAHHATSFGVMGTYGKLSLQPVDVEQSQKSKFDKWSVTAYGGMQHDAGFYVNGLFSYGLLKGDVSTLARGKTATLKSNPLSASLTAGKAFKIGHNCLVFDPQIQVIYQNLRFDKASDIDGFDIEMGKPEQWMMRVGGRLTKTLPVSKEGSVVSLNGKLHITHGFGEKQFVHLGDSFQLGAFGSSLEAGLGFNAQLSPKFVLYGDATYQQRLSKAGFSGTSFSGGLRYRF